MEDEEQRNCGSAGHGPSAFEGMSRKESEGVVSGMGGSAPDEMSGKAGSEVASGVREAAPGVMPLGGSAAGRSGESAEGPAEHGEDGALAAMATSAAGEVRQRRASTHRCCLRAPGRRGPATTRRQLMAELVCQVSEAARLRKAMAGRPVPGTAAAIAATYNWRTPPQLPICIYGPQSTRAKQSSATRLP